MSARIEIADEAFALGTCGAVVLMVWRGPATRPRLRAASELVERHAARTGGLVAVISVIEAGAPPPDPTGTEMVALDMRALAPSIAAAAFVLEGSAERDDRALETGLVIDAMRDEPLKQKYCFGVAEAAAWIANMCRTTRVAAPERRELLDAVEQTRAAIGG